MNALIPVERPEDIPLNYRDTPIARLLEYHNLHDPFKTYKQAEMLIGMCMDHRKHLHIPDNFSYIIRSGGANLRYSEFKVSYALSIGGVKAIALIGHNNCGMVNLMSRKDMFIQNLMNNAGVTYEHAEEQFVCFAPMFEIGNEIHFILTETQRLRHKYPKIVIAPMHYRVEDNLLYLIEEDE